MATFSLSAKAQKAKARIWSRSSKKEEDGSEKVERIDGKDVREEEETVVERKRDSFRAGATDFINRHKHQHKPTDPTFSLFDPTVQRKEWDKLPSGRILQAISTAAELSILNKALPEHDRKESIEDLEAFLVGLKGVVTPQINRRWAYSSAIWKAVSENVQNPTTMLRAINSPTPAIQCESFQKWASTRTGTVFGPDSPADGGLLHVGLWGCLRLLCEMLIELRYTVREMQEYAVTNLVQFDDQFKYALSVHPIDTMAESCGSSRWSLKNKSDSSVLLAFLAGTRVLLETVSRLKPEEVKV